MAHLYNFITLRLHKTRILVPLLRSWVAQEVHDQCDELMSGFCFQAAPHRSPVQQLAERGVGGGYWLPAALVLFFLHRWKIGLNASAKKHSISDVNWRRLVLETARTALTVAVRGFFHWEQKTMKKLRAWALETRETQAPKRQDYQFSLLQYFSSSPTPWKKWAWFSHFTLMWGIKRIIYTCYFIVSEIQPPCF